MTSYRKYPSSKQTNTLLPLLPQTLPSLHLPPHHTAWNLKYQGSTVQTYWGGFSRSINFFITTPHLISNTWQLPRSTWMDQHLPGFIRVRQWLFDVVWSTSQQNHWPSSSLLTKLLHLKLIVKHPPKGSSFTGPHVASGNRLGSPSRGETPQFTMNILWSCSFTRFICATNTPTDIATFHVITSTFTSHTS